MIETHPWPPFIPNGAKILVLGTFPPGVNRHAIDFYYPNPINDFWRIMGLIFFGDKMALFNQKTGLFDVDCIKAFLTGRGIAVADTVRRARRLRGNASDKYLEVVEPLPLAEWLATMPQCHTIATTGEKAASIIADLTSTVLPRMGQWVEWGKYSIWRMPSTSRAYPMRLEAKAEYYKKLFASAGILVS